MAVLFPESGIDRKPSLSQTGRWFDLLVLLLFFLTVGFLRVPAFEQSVVDWDESIYLLMSRGMLEGHLPYTAVWDHKPPGIYLLFALAQLLFGRSIVAIRVLTWLAVTASCFLLYKFGKDRFHNGWSGILAGLLYAAFSLQNGGLAANSEVLFAPFVILGFYLLWQTVAFDQPTGSNGGRTILLAGLALGVALQIKYAVIYDLIAALMLLAITGARKRYPVRDVLYGAVTLLAGVLIPMAVVVLTFLLSGHLPEYVDATILANLRYNALAIFSLTELGSTLSAQLRHNFVLWGSLLLLPMVLFVTAKARQECRLNLLLLCVWLAIDLMGILLARRYFWHYFLQLLPPLCLIVSILFTEILAWTTGSTHKSRLVGFGLLALLAMGVILPLWRPVTSSVDSVLFALGRGERVDEPAYIGSYLRDRLEPGQTVYVADYEPVIYFLAGVEAPTRYVLPRLLTDEALAAVAGIDPSSELARIMRGKPAYVVLLEKDRDASRFHSELHGYLDRDYVVDRVVRDATLFRRQDQGGRK
ncbi:MAG: glycosyltransferase family 39 protein [Chloroflexota bacterium]|nr:glycosyltransferase family 39 protein [Chloroflexota bacterium]